MIVQKEFKVIDQSVTAFERDKEQSRPRPYSDDQG